jgi:hypothetical protein
MNPDRRALVNIETISYFQPPSLRQVPDTLSQATAFLTEAIYRHFRSLCLVYRDSSYGQADSFASFRLQYSALYIFFNADSRTA